jgi:hypothetical protein
MILYESTIKKQKALINLSNVLYLDISVDNQITFVFGGIEQAIYWGYESKEERDKELKSIKNAIHDSTKTH